MNSTIKRYGISILIFLAGLISGAGLTHLANKVEGASHTSLNIAPDTEIFSVLDEEVMSLTYKTAALTLSAQRSKPAEAFAVQVTFSDGRKPQQCLASPDLAGQLLKFSTITAKRKVLAQQIEKEFPHQLGTLEIRDRMLVETAPLMTLHTTADRKVVVVSYDGHAAEISTPIAAFAKLEAGCKTLAQH